MKFDHRIGRVIFVVIVSAAVVLLTHRWVTDPAPRAQRQAEEAAVLAAREFVSSAVDEDTLELVDPLSPDRKVGKVYVYAEAPGWAVSGYYRRNEHDAWHPYLVYLTEALELHSFKTEDDSLKSP